MKHAILILMLICYAEPRLLGEEDRLTLKFDANVNPLEYSNDPIVIPEKKPADEFDLYRKFGQLFFLTDLSTSLNLKIDFKKFALDVLPSRLDARLRMLRPLQINFAKLERYVDSFIPNLLIGEPGIDLTINYGPDAATGLSAAAIQFWKDGSPTSTQVKLMTRKLGQFNLRLTQIEAIGRWPENPNDDIVVPLRCQIPAAALRQKLSCLAIIWKNSEAPKGRYRFLIYGNHETTDEAALLNNLGKVPLDLTDFFETDRLANQASVLKDLDHVSIRDDQNNAALLRGIPGQALLIIEGSFNMMEEDKFFVRLLIKPESRDFSIPGVLPGFAARLSKRAYVHVIYQDLDPHLPLLALDFTEIKSNGSAKPVKIDMAWRPFLTMVSTVHEPTFQTTLNSAPLKWTLSDLAVATIDQPFAWGSRLFLHSSGDRFILKNQHEAELWNRGKSIRTIHFNSPPLRSSAKLRDIN
jgi:hypothetical protein